ncbi:hypothetical protein LWI29_020304 [Acer saccharum]|uniref:Uncharacterized protein n=1 Tax=Acer saccharum TaxID=4024 RepID=A0AA39RSA8_ACESA|nr:hypothetical protein LWI29_020304 [Acer saccharum]
MDTNLRFYGDPYLTTIDILLGTVERPKAELCPRFPSIGCISITFTAGYRCTPYHCDIATAGCHDFSIIPASSRATSGSNRAISAMLGNAPVATLVAPDNAPAAHLAALETDTVAHPKTGLAAHPPVATATHPMRQALREPPNRRHYLISAMNLPIDAIAPPSIRSSSNG